MGVAELERSLICERMRVGIRNARTEGKRHGRPSVGREFILPLPLRVTGWIATFVLLLAPIAFLKSMARGSHSS